ncbi:MAG: cupredoxin domain-containing protein [Candidatus Methanoperedens sp.]|nr:cupredoxin domain-containing protein [Candidatus Methanoperedens sp.]
MTNTQRLLILILAVVMVVSSGCTEKTADAASGMKSQHNNTEKNMEPGGMPTIEKQESKESKEAVIKGDFQEIDLKINASGYSPNVIIAKKDIPLRINIYAQDESHANTIVFPDFGIEKKIFPGSLGIIEILPTQEGTFKFRCPMDMVRGELIIK